VKARVPNAARFSAIIPTFNRGGFIHHAIDSVLAQAPTVEIIVVDDGSTDDTHTVVSRYGSRVRYLRQANRGVSAARNRGAHEATADWIAFLDSDDEWNTDALAAHERLLKEHPTAVCSVLNSVAVDLHGSETDYFEEAGFDKYFAESSQFLATRPLEAVTRFNITTLQSVVFRRDVFISTRLFDETLPIGEDFDAIAHMALRGAFVFSNAIGARVVRRPEAIENLSKLFRTNTIQTRLHWDRVFQRLLEVDGLSRQEADALRARRASNLRGLGNAYRDVGMNVASRESYQRAFGVDRSIRSGVRLAAAHIALIPGALVRLPWLRPGDRDS
jgi:glycosyltransferase involved in cell wall biosynthesis